MIPDLGKYAVEVMLAYGAGLVLLTALVAAYVIRNRAVAKALAQAEARRDA